MLLILILSLWGLLLHSPLCFVATMWHISSIRSLNRCTSSLVLKPCVIKEQGLYSVGYKGEVRFRVRFRAANFRHLAGKPNQSC